MKELIIAALALATAFAVTGCSSQNADTGSVQTENTVQAETSPVDMTLSEKSFAATDEYVKLIGRSFFDDADRILWLAQSASGVEFKFTGTSASVALKGDSNSGLPTGKDAYARYAVYVDGERIADGMMEERTKTVEIFSSDSEKETTVKILKLSETANSTLGIQSINVTSMGNIAPTDDKDLKIEFIGDSITCGYGVDDEVKEHHFVTDTEDATKAYAVKTAELLDADYSLVSFSGHGIISGYSGDGKIQSSQTVPEYYAKVGRSYGGKSGLISVSNVDWDFDRYTPDVVVINLGTNDDSYTKSDPEKIQAYTDGYVAFLGTVREHNPDAYILCTLGIMGDNLYPAVENAVSTYSEQSGDTKVSAMKFDVQNPEDGYAADWHPTEKTHEKAAQKLADEIKTILGQ